MSTHCPVAVTCSLDVKICATSRGQSGSLALSHGSSLAERPPPDNDKAAGHMG